MANNNNNSSTTPTAQTANAMSSLIAEGMRAQAPNGHSNANLQQLTQQIASQLRIAVDKGWCGVVGSQSGCIITSCLGWVVASAGSSLTECNSVV